MADGCRRNTSVTRASRYGSFATLAAVVNSSSNTFGPSDAVIVDKSVCLQMGMLSQTAQSVNRGTGRGIGAGKDEEQGVRRDSVLGKYHILRLP